MCRVSAAAREKGPVVSSCWVGAQEVPPPGCGVPGPSQSPLPIRCPVRLDALYLVVQRAGQLHFPSGRSDSEEVGIGAAHPIGQIVIVLVFSYQTEGLGTWG